MVKESPILAESVAVKTRTMGFKIDDGIVNGQPDWPAEGTCF